MQQKPVLRLIVIVGLFLGLGLAALPAPAPVFATTDRPQRWESGDSWAGAPGWSSYASLTASAGASYILTTSSSATGNKYLRFADDNSSNRYGPSGTSDINLGIETSNNLQDWNSGNGKAYYVNVASASYTYIFKTDGTNNGKVIVFEVQGAVRTIGSTTRAPAGTVWPGSSVTINATLSGNQTTGQGVYLRYSTDSFATSTIVEMACGGSSSCSASIPAGANSAGATISYYLFTSGDGMTIASADADYATINSLNNGGSNYTYTVQPDGVIEEEYGSTRMIDLAVGKAGDQDACESDEKSDLIDFNAFSYHASSASSGQWFMSFTIDSSANLNSGVQQGYLIGLDTGTKGSPTIDLSSAGVWQRNVAFPGDYFIGLYPSGGGTLSSGLYDSSRTAVSNTTVTVVTKVVSTRRQIEVTLSGSGVPAALTDNSAVNFLVMSVSDANGDNVNDAIGSGVTTECATGKTTYAQSDMQTSEAQCKASGRPTAAGANDRQCTSNPRRDTVSAINPGATCSATVGNILVDGAVDSGKYTLLAEDTYAGPYVGGQSALSDFDGESSAYKYYSDPNAGTSTSGMGSNLYDASANGARKGAADVESVYARADSNYLYLIVEGPSALGGAGSMAGEPFDRSNLFIALDTPKVASSTDTGGTASESANAPASRRVNFKGWAPDYVIEIVWAGDDTTANNVHLHQWSSGVAWNSNADFQTVLSQGTSASTGNLLFGRAAFGSDGDRKGRFELAIRWSQLGGIVSSSDQLKIGVFTTGDSNLGGVNADDWDIFDQGPGIGQGCTGLACHERVGDDPGDGDSSSQSGGESDETPYVGQTDVTADVEPASDRATRDVDTIEGYYLLTVNAQLIGCVPLAVTLADFAAVQTGDAVLLTWETASELNNRGFNLYRGVSPGAPDRQINETLIPSQSQGNPGGFIYTWEDRAGLVPGTTYFYWVEDVDINGAATRHGPVSVAYGAPTAVRLIDVGTAAALPLALPIAGAGLLGLASAVAWRKRR